MDINNDTVRRRSTRAPKDLANRKQNPGSALLEERMIAKPLYADRNMPMVITRV